MGEPVRVMLEQGKKKAAASTGASALETPSAGAPSLLGAAADGRR
jgi:hypothetical protein